MVEERINKIKTLSALVARSMLATRLGSQYGGERNVYQTLGYKTTLGFDDYYGYYRRQDIAKAIIDRPVEATWRGTFGIVESDDKDTPLELAWEELNNRIGLKSRFLRLDKLASLGNYGVLFLGFNDVSNKEQLRNPVVPGKERKLLYVKPLAQKNAEIKEWETSTTNERYGLPKLYGICINEPGGNTTELTVHHTRIIHVTQELLESECEGVPVLEACFNRLMDLEKLLGGSAEMFWKGGRPGYHGKLGEGAQLTAEEEEELMSQLDEYEHNLRRILLTQNIDLETLASQVADPTAHVDVQIQMISAVTGIPKRILTGSERGELASTEDRKNWFDLIATRRGEYAEVHIVRPFVDRLIEFGVFPQPTEGYSVVWEDLYAQSDKDKAEIGKTRSEALKNYTSTPGAQDAVPLESFLGHFLGFDDDQIDIIMEQRKAVIQEEEREFQEDENELFEEVMED